MEIMPTKGTSFEMNDRKATHVSVGELAAKREFGEGEEHDGEFEGTKSSPDDKMQMQRLGKKQQLIVSWSLQSSGS